MDELGGYTRKELERLCDLGIFPSKLGVGETGDTSAKYLQLWGVLPVELEISEN